MASLQQFPFTPTAGNKGERLLRPYLPFTLRYQQQNIAVSGLLDTGADVNVLPYQLGLQLGAIWEQQTVAFRLTGNLAQFEARALAAQGIVGNLAPAQLVFAWTRAENVPLILGQVNFFLEFNVCFYRSLQVFDISAK